MKSAIQYTKSLSFFHFQDVYYNLNYTGRTDMFGCQRDREEACNSVCQTPTVSSMVRCWLHFLLASFAQEEQFGQKNTALQYAPHIVQGGSYLRTVV